MEKEVLRLFKSYLGDKTNDINKDAMKYGLIIPNSANENVIKEAINQYGIDGFIFNQTFHKDFEIVRNAPIEDLIVQQVYHYITTYGFETLGLYNENMVYIPKEKLEIPELDTENIEMIMINPISQDELKNRLMALLTSGIALSKQTVSDIMVLSDFIDKDRFDEVINKEIKTALYDKYNIMPRNPEEFLRYLIFKTANCTLKIQNCETIEAIKQGDKRLALKMINSYVQNTPKGMDKLSSIFFRNKRFFLAFKTKEIKSMNKTINKIRKLADKNHKPLDKNILDCLTDKNIKIDDGTLLKMLDDVTIFREIRIANGVLYRARGTNNIVHRIRNGKSFTRELEDKTEDEILRLERLYNTIYVHLVNRIADKVKDKTVYIPKNVCYAAPSSEKQFNNNFPEGSYVEIPRDQDLVYGIHWTNLTLDEKIMSRFYGEDDASKAYERVDLDLKQMNKSECFGWDASYRGSSVEFSGDLTDAPEPKGAAELFHVGKNCKSSAFLITLNNFTRNKADVPFEFVIAKSDWKDVRKNYVLDPNDILVKINMIVEKDKPQNIIGFIIIDDNIRFYFNDFSAGGNVQTSSQNKITMGAFDYLQAYNKIQIKLGDLLKDAGAILTTNNTIIKTITKSVFDENGEELGTEEVQKEVPVDYDLSMNSITKETIIGLLS